MTAIEKLNSPTEEISNNFLRVLADFAYWWRQGGQFGYNTHGAYEQLQVSWRHEFGEELNGPEKALELCRELVARGKGAFTV
jgi:hypothetical protein